MNQAESHILVKPRILLAPLDWGLGHTTRCIPIIKELLALDCDVWLGCDNKQKALFDSEFAGLPYLFLPGYNIRYSKTKRGLSWKMLLQLPGIFSSVNRENKWLKKMVDQHRFNAVISDNRFGLHHQKIPCIFITHQLTIKTSLSKWTERSLQHWNYKYINRFSECWVPDAEGENNLAGELSHPFIKPKTPLHYTGPVSRFEKNENNEIEDHLLFVLSGPEPQRTIFENKIIDEISHYPATATIVRGLPGEHSLLPSTNMIRFYNNLSSAELNKEINKAGWIISRCGYTTVMDVVKLKKKSILIPTPGQTEQEYLAQQLQKRKISCCIDQNDFFLPTALQQARKFDYKIPEMDFSGQLKEVIQNFVARLK